MTRPAEPALAAPERFDHLDALRGFALVWMTAYHLAFDLNWFGLIRQDFYRDPLWTAQRAAILSLFLISAGMGQAIAQAQGQGWPRFWRRWSRIALAAALVSLGSWLTFPQSWISFGVLHGMALMLILTRALLGTETGTGTETGAGAARGRPITWLFALIFAAGPLGSAWLVQNQYQMPTLAAWLDSRWLYGLGWVTHKPHTEDYVPLLPWWGVMLLGAVLAQALLRAPHIRAALARPLPRPLRALAVLGRWSLLYYLLHQPILIGALTLWQKLR